MLKRRVAAGLVVKDNIVVQSIGFQKYLPVGKPEIAIEFLNQWGIDEIILTDISATASKRSPNFEMLRKATKKCYVPISIGGGITHTDHIKELMHCGADKISINQAAIHQPDLITEAAHIFGNQCIVVSIDAVWVGDGHKVYDYVNKKLLNMTPAAFAKKVEDCGAGEIFINSVDRDGSYKGYDIDLLNAVCDEVTVPVIGCGGAKNAADFIEVFKKTKISAACAANFFHFSEHSVNVTKAIVNREIPIRLETHADYKESSFDEKLRPKKKDDAVLEEMLFLRIEKEVI